MLLILNRFALTASNLTLAFISAFTSAFTSVGKGLCRQVSHKLIKTSFVCAILVSLTTFANAMNEEMSATENLTMAGLKEPVEIRKDQWGISHIYANNQHDLFFSQGFNAARDRLFQFELWRRRATGTLAEIQGEKALAHDKGARLLRFQGSIDAEMEHYHDDGIEIITAFVAGVNAYIDLTRSEPERLPFEFELLGIKPGKWTPEVVVSRHNALTGGISTELMLAKTITSIGPELTAKVLDFERTPYLGNRDGVDLSQVTDAVMTDYLSSRRMPAFSRSDVIETAAANSDKDDLAQGNEIAEYLLDPINTSLGSNNWVISGDRTASGKPIMANDPHRAIQNPSLRYMVHLNAPGWNVIGAGEPVLPGVSIGHNDHGAWGLTIFRIDQEDLYVYEINPENTNQYRYKGQWKNMRVEHDTINIKGRNPEAVELKYTIHGPVVHEDSANGKAYAIRAAWLEQGAAPYLASLRMDQATNWAQFRAACEYSGLPGENMVWADKYGDIGWQSVGLTPIRLGWDGRLPVPGNGDFEWQGYAPVNVMPHITNPTSGYYGTANHNNVPKDYPNIFADFYSDPARAARLVEVLSQTKGHTIQDSMQLQYDSKSMTAEVIVPVITDINSNRKIRGALKLLKAWDFRLDRKSAAAALYDRWEQGMLMALNRDLLPNRPAQARQLISRPKLKAWMVAPPEFVFGKNPARARDKMIKEQLGYAIDSLNKEFGKELGENTWTYGDIHFSSIDHPLKALVDAEKWAALKTGSLEIGPLARGGGGNTLNANHGTGKQTAGASFRMIADTADWNTAVGTNTPGQSGDPSSPYYDNLFENWNKGEYFPLYFSSEAIKENTHSFTRLTPAQ